MAGWLPLFAPGFSFNGGLAQTNVSALQTGGGFPFLNQMKQAQLWSRRGSSANSPVTPDLLDSDGYPLSTITDGIDTVFFVPSQFDRPGRYAVTWDGNGTVIVNMTLSSATGSKTSSTGSGRYEFLPGTDRFVIGIETVGSPRITNLKVFHVDDEASLNAGEVFSTYFKSKLRDGGFGVIRFLGWGGYADGYNKSNIAKWSMRKPTTYVFYDGPEVRSGDYAGATSLSGQAYTTANTPNGFTLADKAWFHALIAQSYPGTQISFSNGSANIGWTSHGLSVNSRVVLSNNVAGDAGTPATNFSLNTLYYVVSVPNANTVTLSATQGGTAIVADSVGSGIVMGNPQFTINVNGTGAKWVINENSSYLTEGNNTRPIANTYQSLATFVYDAGLDAYIKFGGDGGYNSVGIDNGVPPELQVRLCAEVGAHPWMIMPFLTTDPVTDYVPEVISLVKNYPGASWMIPRFEVANEVWNFSPVFFGTSYGVAKAAVNWPGTGANHHDWYGKASSTLGQTAESVYGGGLGTSYHVMLGVQTISNPADSDERAEASKYVAQAAAAQSLTWSGGTINYTKSPASEHVSVICPANYVSPSEYGEGDGTPTEAARVTDFNGVRFVASISAGTMVVSQIDTSGGTLAIGKTVFGRGISNGELQSGVTITGGSAPTWTLSDGAITLASDTFYAADDMTQPALYVDSLGGSSSGFNLAAVDQKYIDWKAWGSGHSINNMHPYEGGYSPDFKAGPEHTRSIFRGSGKLVMSSPGSATGLQGYTLTNYNNLVAAGGEFPSLFLPTGTYPVDNVWSVLNDIYQPDTPQWLAVKDFNQ